jgi:hypothetical protein
VSKVKKKKKANKTIGIEMKKKVTEMKKKTS